MDTITHALSGGLAAWALPRRTNRVPRGPALITGLAAGAFPDIDVVVALFDPVTFLTAHRGVTHSLILWPAWACLLALGLAAAFRRRYSWRGLFPLCLVAVGIHIAGDVITAFGTKVLAPFSDWRASLDTTFILDPYFSGILLAGLIAGVLWQSRHATAARAGLLGLAAYVGGQALLHHQALELGARYAQAHELNAASVRAIPQPLSPFRWKVVVAQPDVYHTAFVDLAARQAPEPVSEQAGVLQRLRAIYQPRGQTHWEQQARYGGDAPTAAVARRAWHQPALAGFRAFATLPFVYRVDRSSAETCVWFSDLRFTLPGRTPPFRYGVCRQGQEPWQLFRLPRSGQGPPQAPG